MEVVFYLATACLLLFMVLATYDGAYLHLWKFELFKRKESSFEHKIHTVRAILFPVIVFFLFVKGNDFTAFLIGISLVVIDLIALAIDAYSEEDSRKFMNGLPKWEYILHLFSNTFHFASIILIVTVRFSIEENSLMFISGLPNSFAKELFDFVAVNIIPGALILAVVHVILSLDFGKRIWTINRSKITCC